MCETSFIDEMTTELQYTHRSHPEMSPVPLWMDSRWVRKRAALSDAKEQLRAQHLKSRLAFSERENCCDAASPLSMNCMALHWESWRLSSREIEHVGKG